MSLHTAAATCLAYLYVRSATSSTGYGGNLERLIRWPAAGHTSTAQAQHRQILAFVRKRTDEPNAAAAVAS